MSPLERLLLEAIPTGRFGAPRPQPPRWDSRPDAGAITRRLALAEAVWPEDPDAARHRADLETALDEAGADAA